MEITEWLADRVDNLSTVFRRIANWLEKKANAIAVWGRKP